MEKTLELILIIGLGYLLQRKISDRNSLKGLKTIVLSVALPATIFIALLKIELEVSLLFLPVLALCYNLVMLIAALYLLPYFFPPENKLVHRTRAMLVPSLAPGLSCFPFIISYLGEEQLALTALADVGNKFFGLILLFLLATYWFNKKRIASKKASTFSKIKQLLYSLIKEPINLVLVCAIVLLCFGINFNDLPNILHNTISRLSLLMVPLILLFIGLSVRIGRKDLLSIIQLLTWRSGLAFILAGMVLAIIPDLSVAMSLIIVVFPQSSCSFWPFAHMHTVATLEKNENLKNSTFDQVEAINILACSLPFSTTIILGIFYSGETLINPAYLLIIGSLAIIGSALPRLWLFVSMLLKKWAQPMVFNARRNHHSVRGKEM